MSHFTRMKTTIRDGEVLVRCLRESGYRVELDTKIRGYQGSSQAVDIAVRLSEGYDVGFSRSADGTYEIVGDWWGVRGTSRDAFARTVGDGVRAIEEEMRRQAEELERRMRREYALEKTLKELKQQGFSVVEKVAEDDGTVRLMARRYR